MNIDTQITMNHNYRFIIAAEKQIATFIACGRFEKSIVSLQEIMMSIREGTWAAQLWIDITREFIPSFCKVSHYHNLVPNVLRYQLATLISGTTVTPTFKANYLALGTGSTTPANSDTQLQTETLRAVFTQRQAVNNVAYLDSFFSSTLVAGNTYNEAGIFVDGTSSANTGYLLSHVAINQTIGANQTLTINSTITLS